MSWIPEKESWMDDNYYSAFKTECERLLPDGPDGFADRFFAFLDKLPSEKQKSWADALEKMRLALLKLEESLTPEKIEANERLMRMLFGKRDETGGELG